VSSSFDDPLCGPRSICLFFDFCMDKQLDKADNQPNVRSFLDVSVRLVTRDGRWTRRRRLRGVVVLLRRHAVVGVDAHRGG